MHARALGFDSLQYLVVGRVVSQCVSKVFECLLVNAKLEEKAENFVTGEMRVKKRATDTREEKKTKNPHICPLIVSNYLPGTTSATPVLLLTVSKEETGWLASSPLRPASQDTARKVQG